MKTLIKVLRFFYQILDEELGPEPFDGEDFNSYNLRCNTIEGEKNKQYKKEA